MRSLRRLWPVSALTLLLAATVVHAAPPPWETGQSRGEDLVISVVTFGPGDDIPSYFGHIGVVVQDTRLRDSRLYNYGMFTFDDTMVLKFIRGRLEFWVGEDAVGPTLEFYKVLNRDVLIQVLNLSPEARIGLARALADNVLPENRNYLYNHYFDNCATRPRDLIDRAVGGALMAQTRAPGRWTLREHTLRFGWVDPLLNLAMDFGLNDIVDKPLPQSGEAFLPAELANQLSRATYVNAAGERVPLVVQRIEYFKSTRAPTPERPPSYTLALLVVGLVLGAIPVCFGLLVSRRRRLSRVGLGGFGAAVGLLLGLLGVLLAFFWLSTDHLVAHHNENLFLTSPLALLAVPLGVSLARGKRSGAARRFFALWAGMVGLALLGALLKLLPWFDQRNGLFFALFLPLLSGLALGSWLYRRGLPPGS